MQEDTGKEHLQGEIKHCLTRQILFNGVDVLNEVFPWWPTVIFRHIRDDYFLVYVVILILRRDVIFRCVLRSTCSSLFWHTWFYLSAFLRANPRLRLSSPFLRSSRRRRGVGLWFFSRNGRRLSTALAFDLCFTRLLLCPKIIDKLLRVSELIFLVCPPTSRCRGIPSIVFIHPAVVLLTIAFPLHEVTNFSLNVKKIKKGQKTRS